MTRSFKEQVLAIVREIPKGETRSYKEVAVQAGSLKAARAVGAIMRANTDMSVPCHRVIHTNGKVGKYNGLCGASKRSLLQKEGAL